LAEKGIYKLLVYNVLVFVRCAVCMAQTACWTWPMPSPG